MLENLTSVRKGRGNTGPKLQIASLPAPTGGLNSRDPLSGMKASEAIELTNFVAWPDAVYARNGYLEFADTIPTAPAKLLGYNGVSSSALFVATTSSIYDVSSGGTVGAATATGFSDGNWSHVNFGGAAGNFLVAVNDSSADPPQFYDGSTWTYSNGGSYAADITGVDARLLIAVTAWKDRLVFIEKDSLRVWYLGSLAIGGAANYVELAGVAKNGGHLVSIGTLSSNAGSSPEDYIWVSTSRGEFIVYGGTDITDPTQFGIVGQFFAGAPINKFSHCRIGADVIILTTDGITTLQALMQQDTRAENLTISDKARVTFRNAYSSYAANTNWGITVAPKNNLLVVNIPVVTGSEYNQLVMHTQSKGWSEFDGWDMTDFIYWDDKLYGCGGTSVWEMDVEDVGDAATSSSVGNSITHSLRTSFQAPGGAGSKIFLMARPLITSSLSLTPNLNVNVDYDVQSVSGGPTYTAGAAALWGVSLWGIGLWGGGINTYKRWISINGTGYTVSLVLQISTNGKRTKFIGWEVAYQQGGLI